MKNLWTILFCAFFLLSGNLSYASTLLLSGYITSVDSSLSAEFASGESFAFTYELNPGASDLSSDSRRGDYYSALVKTTLQIGDYSLSAQGGSLFIGDGSFSFSSADIYAVNIDKWRGNVYGDAVGVLFPYAVEAELLNLDGTAFSNDSLFLTAPNLEQFDGYRNFYLAFAKSMDGNAAYGVQRIYGTINYTTLISEPSINTVPEPATMLLFGTGLVGAFLRKRRA